MVIMCTRKAFWKIILENRRLNLYDIVSPTNEGYLYLHESRKLFTKQLKLIRYD